MDLRESLITKYPEITSAPAIIETKIMWGHMDSANHVNNLIYLQWAETARVLYFEKMGMDTTFSGAEGPILGWQDGKYIYPLTYPDDVLVTEVVIELLEDRFVLESKIYSLQKTRIAAISKQHIIPYSYKELKKIPLPDKWISNIKRLQSTF